MEFKIIFVAFWPLQNLKCLFSRIRAKIAMALAGRNSPLEELSDEGSNSINDPGNPEICPSNEISVQIEEERKMHAFGFDSSACEDESIPAHLYDIDNQGCAVRYDESSDDEEIFDDPGQKFATDDDGATRKKGGWW